MTPTLSIIIPTISRPSLAHTLGSLRHQDLWDTDEVLLVGDGPQPIAKELFDQYGLPGRYIELPERHNDYGHTPRNIVMPQAKGDFILAIDDDDTYMHGAIRKIRDVLKENPDKPHIFRMQTPNGILWHKRELIENHVGTPMFVVPNVAPMLGSYSSRYGGDFDFIKETVAMFHPNLIWHQEVIVLVTHQFSQTSSHAS